MPEYTFTAGGIGRSIHDCPEPSHSEMEAERVEAVMARVSRHQLEEALVILLSAIRTAEGEQGRLYRDLFPHVAQRHKDAIDNIGAALIEEGIDRVCDLIGHEALEILEEKA